MLNIRKRFFLLLTIVGVLLGFTACVSSKDTVRVSFDKPEYTVKVGQVLDITPIIEKGSNVEKVTIEYSSTNPDVATYVDGKLTGLQAGEAEIRIVCSEKPVAFDVATVKVVENEIPDVQFVEPQKSMIKGTTQTLQYKFVPEYASANMTFESANPDIATVDENGVISAVKAGKATIIARAIDVNDATQHKDYVFTIEVIEADFAINYVLNDGVNNPDNPAGYNILTLPLEILAPTKEAYRFLGWYDNAEFNGDPITEIAAGTTGDVTLYAKWELVIYSIVYELNGGTNAETNPDTYNIENLPLTLADPTKAGYTFLGWYNGETKVTEVPAGTTGEFKVEAKWQINEYTISYDLAEGAWEGTAGVGSYTIESEDIVLPNPVRNGYKFLGWYNVDEKVETITKGSTGNLELVAKWEIEKYSINYELNGGAFDSVAEISKDAKHTFTISDYLTFAAATGYKNALVNKASGRWWAYVVLQKTAVPGLYKVVQMANGSTKITEQYDMLITWHSALKDTAAKTILNGMLNNSGAYVGSYIKVSNVPAEKTADCNITAEVFDKDAIEIKDSSVKSYTIEDEVTLATPTKEGQVFLGWYNGENKVETIAKGSTGEVTVTAKWYNPNAELTLNCELNGGTLPEGAVIKFISKDGLATLPTPEKVGYTFKGWYADSECTQLVTSIEAGLSENPTVYAAWQINTYKITYETNGGEFQVDKTVPLYDSFEDLVAAFLSDYASFYNISGLTAASFFGKTNQYGPYGFFKNAEMNAKWGWLAEYILTVAKSTNYVGKANLVMGAGAANYNKYMRSNLAAFLQKAKLTNVTPVPMNFVNADCDALWAACPTKEIKVGIAAKYEYTVEELPLELATPVKGEAKFIGWYLNADLKNGKVEKLTIENLGDVKLYARWSDSEIEFDTYEIEYELNGGTLPEDAPKQYVEEAGAVLKDPTQTGYTFKGWFLDAECTQKVTEISKESKGNVKLYAAWEAIEYKVTFEVGEGKLPTEQVPVGKYEDYIDFVKDFIVDFNKHSKKTVAADGSDFFARSWMADGSSAGYNFLVSDEYKAKWGWVLTLINQVRVANGKAELTSTDGQAEARGEIHNLLNRTGNGNNGGNAAFGCDYTSADVNEQVWKYIEKVHYVDKVIDLVYTVEQLPITLPNPTAPEGKKFAGWYLNAEYTGEVVNIIAKGTTGDIKLYAKYVDEGVEVKGKINYELFGATLSEGAPTEYVQGTVLEITATATKAGYIFKGWYLDEAMTIEVKEISASMTGDITLYAKLEADVYEITFVGATGLDKQTLAYGTTLPVPSATGWKFAGWYENPECTGEAVTTVTKSVTLYAKWVEDFTTFDHTTVEISVEADGTGDYKTLKEAYDNASDYTVIRLGAGTFDLDFVIAKSVEIIGKSKGETTIKVAADYINKVNAENIVISDVTLKGVGANVGGIYFQPGTKAHYFTVKNSEITDMNTFYKSVSAMSNNVVLTLENNTITKVGQFLIWATTGIDTVYLVDNAILASNCGTIANGAAALLRMRDGKTYVYNNVFTGTTPSIAGLFEAGTDNVEFVEVKYNIFKNVTKFVYIKDGKPVNFDENLYLDAEGNVLTAVPSQVTGNGVTADTTIATSEVDRATRYAKVTKTTNIRFMPGQGAIQDNWSEFTTHNGKVTMLPYAQLDDHYFLGWCTDEACETTPIMALQGEQAGTVILYAKFQQIPVNKINYELNGGTLPEGAPREWKEGTSVKLVNPTKAESTFAGWYTNAECTGEAITEISASQKGDITLYARWENWTFKNINYELNGGTLPEGAANKYPLTQGLKELPTPTKDGFKFLGWYGNAECTGDAITSISADATEDVNLWALWLDLSKSYNITYVLNGGNSLYADRAALVADLLNDLNTTCGKSITASKFTSNCRKPEFTKFITDDTMWAKWKWLFQYLADTDKHEKAADVYKGVLENRTVSDDFWFLTRDFAGFVNKTVGNFYYSVNAIDFTTFAAGDGFWNLIQTEINDPKAVELLTPNYPYYEFEGWYDNPEFTGERVLVPSKDGKLYAKWSKKMATLTYSIGDVDATVTNETVKVHASDSFVLETPTYDPKYLRFNGWYKEAECINPITEISEYTTQDITVYASWTEIDGYTINYVLNGGSLIYQDRDAVIADFIKDYNEAIGTSYASAADIPTGNFADINYHTFYTKVLSDGTVIRDKWLWLAQYLLRLSQRDLAGNNCNVLGLSALVNNKAYSGDAIYGISYAFRSFLKGTTLRPGSSYTSVDYTVYENAHGFWNDLSAAENGEYLNNKGTVTLPTAYLENYRFAGWFTNAECTGEPVTTVSDTATLYAKYVEATPVESVTITNKITEIKRYETYQLQWQVLPTNANIQAVKFESSDTRVATVDVNGLVTAVSEGDVEIKVISLSPSGKSDSLKLNVYAPDHFKISYETVSYVKVGGSIKLNASYIKRDGSATELEWSSVTPEIATVDENGKVTAVKEGLATIRVSAKGNADIKQDFVVTVLPATLSKELQEVVDAHESNAFIRWDLGIGAGGPAYYRDIYGSVSKVLYNDALVIDTKYKATQDGISTNHGAEMSAIDFITVHYTGNMSPKADANANAGYFAGGGGGTSIHYVTGNDGVFYCLDEKYGGYHAGDSSMGERKWIKTGIKATSDDPETPVWGISSNSKFTLNGQETIVNVPEGTTDATKKVTGNTFVYNGKVQNCINDMGLAWKIADGEYYMLDTWWCYSQVSAGRICNYGGNRNSIGIESAVNPESDLWYTWQRTAQLVANIMVRHNLDTTRVVGHHFWTAKDCPQPLLENNLEIWDIFIESVKHEYKLITDFKDTKFAFTCDSDIIGKNGRVATQPLFSQIVTYTVEVNGEKITLATMVEGRYNKK